MPKLDYYNKTYKGLSYSRRLVLHGCPRKYEIEAKTKAAGVENNVTFAYGHAVGQAIQSTIEGKSFERVILDTITAYHYSMFGDITSSEFDSKKNIWWAVDAATKIYKLLNTEYSSPIAEWELAYFTDDEGKKHKAVELTFVIDLGDGYSYEGHIDVVLKHKHKNLYMVLELKTTGVNALHEAQYKNSDQGVGYSVVIDKIAQDMDASNSYQVLYLVYKSRTQEVVPMPFTKTVMDRARWLNSLIADVESIRIYEQIGYPVRGESCLQFNRPCRFFHKCKLSNNALNLDPQEDQYAQMEKPTFFFTIDEIIETQRTIAVKYMKPEE